MARTIMAMTATINSKTVMLHSVVAAIGMVVRCCHMLLESDRCDHCRAGLQCKRESAGMPRQCFPIQREVPGEARSANSKPKALNNRLGTGRQFLSARPRKFQDL